MKLKVFNTQNCVTKAGKKYPPALNIRFDGRITLNDALIKKLNLKAGDKIEFSHDEENPTYWLLSICKNDAGFALYSKFKSCALSIHSAVLAQKIFDSVEATAASSLTIKVAPFPQQIKKIDYYELLTSSMIIREIKH